jgi:hypothetical protein
MVPNALTASMVEFERVSDDDDHGHEREIRQAFDVLDVRGDKSISVQDLQTIYLGLGYVPPVSVEELQRRTLQYDDSDERDHSARVTLDTTLKILLQVRLSYMTLPETIGCPPGPLHFENSISFASFLIPFSATVQEAGSMPSNRGWIPLH